ncbi:AraC family transcriptional regulator [Brevundimonas diminuta]|uniref:helix-turn-helix transcriptional regulator n=1 Tax=Brevundimonas diminuta TaxID=293 RepID=UPI0030F8E791
MNSILATTTDTRNAGNRAIPAAAHGALPRCSAIRERTGEDPAILRQRFKAGRIDFDYRAFPRQRAVTLAATDAMIHIVVPLAGTAVVVGDDQGFTDKLMLGVGSAFLLASSNRTVCVWASGAGALMLHIPRAAIQAAASRMTGEPRRLAASDHLFQWSPAQAGLTLPRPVAGGSVDFSEAESAIIERRALTDLLTTLLATPEAGALFPVARSVQRAVEQIRAKPQQNWSVHDLAPFAGVTVATLRRNFRTCLGVTVTQLVQQIRLDWVRARLESRNESRSISNLSLAAGFGASGMLTRAYQRRFGETPSQTRTRIFRSQGD